MTNFRDSLRGILRVGLASCLADGPGFMNGFAYSLTGSLWGSLRFSLAQDPAVVLASHLQASWDKLMTNLIIDRSSLQTNLEDGLAAHLADRLTSSLWDDLFVSLRINVGIRLRGHLEGALGRALVLPWEDV
jgi:hypothetical protein